MSTLSSCALGTTNAKPNALAVSWPPALSVAAQKLNNIESKNPIAWPYHADASMLEGLPPHSITVNELDPLRDEGLFFSRKLEEAGVSVSTKIIRGTVHAAENIFPLDIPIIHNQAIQDIKNFSYGLE